MLAKIRRTIERSVGGYTLSFDLEILYSASPIRQGPYDPQEPQGGVDDYQWTVLKVEVDPDTWACSSVAAAGLLMDDDRLDEELKALCLEDAAQREPPGPWED